MIDAFPNNHDLLNTAITGTLLRLNDRLGSDAEVARRIGVTRSAATKFKNGDALPSLRVAWRLSRLASCEGIDLVADAFSCQGKRTLPAPEAMPPPNCSTREENEALLVCGGLLSVHLSGGDFTGARRMARGIIRAGWALLAEIDAFEAAGSRPSGGDGLASDGLAGDGLAILLI